MDSSSIAGVRLWNFQKFFYEKLFVCIISRRYMLIYFQKVVTCWAVDGWVRGSIPLAGIQLFHPVPLHLIALLIPKSIRRLLVMNSMKLVIPLHFISWKKTPNGSVTPQRQSQFTPKMKANAVPRLLSSLVWIDQYNECNGIKSFMEFMYELWKYREKSVFKF